MKINLMASNLRTIGASHIDTFMTHKQSSAVEKGKLSLSRGNNEQARKEGFYFISIGDAIVHISHAGRQKKQRGFMEVLSRFNNPRTAQNEVTSEQIYGECCKGQSTQLYWMSYAQVRMMLGIEEYSSMNNGRTIITELRELFSIPGRHKS